MIVRPPLSAPIIVGENLTVMTQLPRAATEVPQVFVWEKSPVVAMLLTARAKVVLVFFKVKFEPALLAPTATLPKEWELFERVAV